MFRDRQKMIDDYLKRSGDTELPDGEYVENEHGFCIYECTGKTFILISVYGDGTYWNKWAEDMAKSKGLENIICATRRNPKGFVRKHGYKVVGSVLERRL